MTGVIKMIKESFSSRLRKALEMRGVSQSELSKRTGIGKSSISTYLKGEYKAKQDKVNLLSTALNVSPAWLMGYDVPMVPGTKSEERNYDILHKGALCKHETIIKHEVLNYAHERKRDTL